MRRLTRVGAQQIAMSVQSFALLILTAVFLGACQAGEEEFVNQQKTEELENPKSDDAVQLHSSNINTLESQELLYWAEPTFAGASPPRVIKYADKRLHRFDKAALKFEKAFKAYFKDLGIRIEPASSRNDADFVFEYELFSFLDRETDDEAYIYRDLEKRVSGVVRPRYNLKERHLELVESYESLAFGQMILSPWMVGRIQRAEGSIKGRFTVLFSDAQILQDLYSIALVDAFGKDKDYEHYVFSPDGDAPAELFQLPVDIFSGFSQSLAREYAKSLAGENVLADDIPFLMDQEFLSFSLHMVFLDLLGNKAQYRKSAPLTGQSLAGRLKLSRLYNCIGHGNIQDVYRDLWAGVIKSTEQPYNQDGKITLKRNYPYRLLREDDFIGPFYSDVREPRLLRAVLAAELRPGKQLVNVCERF